ncbi:MAG TPA: type II secretion system protein GspL [Nevskiales bacterium]|nr:type II secretion system protein GspL [Nevskiales bacterium]
MSDTLYIRLDSASDQVSWCLRQTQTGYGHVQTGTLDDALLLARERRLVVLLPSADITLTTVELPAQLQNAPTPRLLQAVPYLLEDRLAEDVETLHFAIGRRSGNRLPVVIAAQARMEGWLKPFRDRGITPAVLVPDLLCVPRVQGPQPVWSVLLEGGQALVRTDTCAGFCCETEMLADFLALAQPPEGLHLQIYPVEHAELPTLVQPVRTAASVTHGLEYLVRGYDETVSVNLLQGEHAATPDYLNWFQPWRLTAALLAAWVVLGTLTLAVEYLRLRHELRGLEQTAETAFRSAFPQVTRIVDLRAQAQQQLAVLKRAGGGAGFLPLLQASSQVLARVSGVQLQEIQYRDGALQLALLAGDTQTLDSLQQGFAQQPGLRLEVESANATGQGVQIRAVVKARS